MANQHNCDDRAQLRPLRARGTRLEQTADAVLVKTCTGRSESIGSFLPFEEVWRSLSGGETLAQMGSRLSHMLGLPEEQCTVELDRLIQQLESMGAVHLVRTPPQDTVDIEQVRAAQDAARGLRLGYFRPNRRKSAVG